MSFQAKILKQGMQKYWNSETGSCLNMLKDIFNRVREKLKHEEDICKD